MDTGNKTKIKRQINQGANSVYNEHNYAASEKTQIKLLTGFVSIAEEQVIGRDEQIAVLTKTFEQNRTVALVNGMGGIGKTTVALLYLSRNQNNYAHIAWIDVSDSIENAFIYNTELQNGLGISEKVNEFIIAKQLTSAFDCILQTMRNLSGKKLLILDNANNHRDLIQGLKKLEKIGWQILATTRDTSANETDYVSVRIDKLDTVDARRVFGLYYHFDKTKIYTEAERNCIDDICRDLDYHTLLIEMVAKSGRANNYGLAALRDIIREGYTHNAALQKRKVATGISGKKAELNATEEQAFIAEHLRNIFKSINWLPENETDKPTIKDLLAYHAVLTPEHHNEKDLLEYFGIDATQPTNIYTQWQLISQNGWLEETTHNDGGMQYKMHPLLQEMILHEKIIGVVSCESVSPLVNYFANYFRMDAKKGDHAIYKKDNLELGKRIIKVFDGDEDIYFAQLQNNLATTLIDLGDFNGARYLVQKGLAMAEKKLGMEHPLTATSQSNLAWILRNLGDLNGARDLMQKALATDEKNFGHDHPSVSIDQSILGLILRNLGDLNGARDVLEKALATDEKNFGPDHPSITISQSNVAMILHDLGDLNGARDLMQKAMATDEKSLGSDHPSVARMQSNLALILHDLGDLNGARDLIEKAYATNIKLLGEAHYQTKIVKMNLDSILAAIKKAEE